MTLVDARIVASADAASEAGAPAARVAGEGARMRMSTTGIGPGDVARAPARAPRTLATADPGTPAARGLYDPALDKDSCGVGFIADIKGRKSHQIVKDALTILLNLEHRGAVGADPRAG